MGLNWTEDELRLKGYIEGPDGVYRRAGPKDSDTREQPRPVQVCRDNNSGEMSELEQGICLKKKRGNGTKKGTSEVGEGEDRFSIIIDSYRKRYMDPDNLCPKWYIDEFVQTGIIPDDSSKYIREVRKRVHKTKGEEYTKITIVKWLP